MKIIILGINAKYTHSMLASWYLKSEISDLDVKSKVLEHTINEGKNLIIENILNYNPDVIAISCYIWNYEYVKMISKELKILNPSLIIIIGGPEVSYENEEFLDKNKFFDILVSGEAEGVFRNIIKKISNNERVEKFYSNNNCIDMELIKSPFTNEMLSTIENKMVYFETSRGCPYNCSYCISSTSKGVRYFDLNRVFAELQKLIDSKSKVIKFIDRTFNSDQKRSIEILKYIKENGKDKKYHFEISAHNISSELMEILISMPKGMIQLEIGVQSVNELTLKLINRSTNIDNLSTNIQKLINANNMHIHLDLIAGLPKEDMVSLQKSFDFVYNLKPHQIQLGFLKMLKGTVIRNHFGKYNYRFRENIPYEIIDNECLTFNEIQYLKGVEDLVDKYYNSNRFVNTIKYLVSFLNSSFDFFRMMKEYYSKNNILYYSFSTKRTFQIFYKFVQSNFSYFNLNSELLKELLNFDYLSCENHQNIPNEIEIENPDKFKEICINYVRNDQNLKKDDYKRFHFQKYRYNLENFKLSDYNVIFDYGTKNNITGLYEHKIINLN